MNKKYLFLFLILVGFVSIGYASLESSLFMNGNVTAKGTKDYYKISIDEVYEDDSNVSQYLSNSKNSISLSLKENEIVTFLLKNESSEYNASVNINCTNKANNNSMDTNVYIKSSKTSNGLIKINSAGNYTCNIDTENVYDNNSSSNIQTTTSNSHLDNKRWHNQIDIANITNLYVTDTIPTKYDDMWDATADGYTNEVIGYLVNDDIYLVTSDGKIKLSSDASNMFSNLGKNTNKVNYIDSGKFDTSEVTTMNYMFSNCSNIENINLSTWNTENVIDMSYMFYNCYNIRNIEFSNNNIGKLTNIKSMFENCTMLLNLDLSLMDFENVTNYERLFYNCSKIKYIYVASSWQTENKNSTDIFTNSGTNKLIFEK